jgi:hypothetical protein
MKEIEDDTRNETTALKQAGEALEELKYTNLSEERKLTEEPKQSDTKLKYLILSLICLITLAM